MLRCSDKSYYIGLTTDVEKRIAEHREKLGGSYTSIRLPIEVVYIQDFATKSDALAVERQLKGWSRKKKEAFLNSNWNELSRLAKKKFK